uniref:Uncharacterized protein n=1 Tax=Arundo donax TaxID=35708 RepID=A0A0A8ZEZ0_ARUDO
MARFGPATWPEGGCTGRRLASKP